MFLYAASRNKSVGFDHLRLVEVGPHTCIIVIQSVKVVCWEPRSGIIINTGNAVYYIVLPHRNGLVDTDGQGVSSVFQRIPRVFLPASWSRYVTVQSESKVCRLMFGIEVFEHGWRLHNFYICSSFSDSRTIHQVDMFVLSISGDVRARRRIAICTIQFW